MNDRRLSTEAEADTVLDALAAAVTVGRIRGQTIVYAVRLGDDLFSAVGYERAPREVVPIAILLPQHAWEQTEQASADYAATKQK